jgi:hypothetical protein
MSIESVYDAIDAQLMTFGIAGGGAFPGAIIVMNETYEPVAGAPYIAATMAAYTRRALTLGTDRAITGGGYLAEHRGIYRVEAVIPQDAGRPLATTFQTQILRLFPRGTTLIGSDGAQVNFDAPAPLPLIGQSGWYRAPVQFPWYYFEAS